LFIPLTKQRLVQAAIGDFILCATIIVILTVLQLFVVTTCKWLINPVTNPNPVFFTDTRDNIKMDLRGIVWDDMD
jgi:hypothetical protein